VNQEANIQDDPYVYPGTSILRNLAELRDEERLERFESDHCFARLLELYENPVPLRFDVDHLKQIHHHLFQDVYAWAGEFRTLNMAKGNSFFARPEYILPELRKILDQLASEHFLQGADSRGFCERTAYFFGEMNAVHPFREGNGRALREFLRELAAEAGYELAWDLATQEEIQAASIASFQEGSSAGFARLLNKIRCRNERARREKMPALPRNESIRADNDVGREANGGGVPVVESIDVVHVVHVGTDGAREMIVLADANGIVRRGALGKGNFPPDAGDVVGFVGLAAANLPGALNGVQIVIKDAVPSEAWPLTTIDDRQGGSGIAQPRAYLVAFVVVRAVELNFVHGAVLLIVKKGDLIEAAGTFHAIEREDDPLTSGKLSGGSRLPALGGADGFAGSLQFKKPGTWTRARTDGDRESDSQKITGTGFRRPATEGVSARVDTLENHVGPTIQPRRSRGTKGVR
jgi:cell filamentation protein